MDKYLKTEKLDNPLKNQEKLDNMIENLPVDFTEVISLTKNNIKDNINTVVDICYKNAYDAGWHTDIDTGYLKDINIGEKLALIHSEISEAMEGARKDLMDDHLTHRKMEEVELADAVIRIFDLSGRRGWDLGGAIAEKLEYNKNRADHKVENRKKDNGKKF